MAKYTVSGGNPYEDSAQGSKSWGVSSKYNGTKVGIGANSRNTRGAERPALRGAHRDYDLGQGLKDDELHPDIPMHKWK